MECYQFLDLPSHLKLEVIKKSYPISFARLRQSCRFLDEFCEKTRKSLGIYCYRRQPHLYLLNSWWTPPFDRILEKNGITRENDISSPHLFLDFGKEDGDHNLMIPMTRENMPKIRESLSGFAITHITVNGSTNGRPLNDAEFSEAVIYFLKLAADFHVRHLSISWLTTFGSKMIVETWKSLETVAFKVDNLEVLRLDCVKKLKSLTFDFIDKENAPNPVDEMAIYEAARSRRVVKFKATNINSFTAVNALWKMRQNWKKEDSFPIVVNYTFLVDVSYYYSGNIVPDWGPLMPEGTEYFGRTPKCMKYLEESQPLSVCDLWIYENEDTKKWQMADVNRVHLGNCCEITFRVETPTSRNELLLLLVQFLHFAFPRYPLDFSGFFKTIETTKNVLRIAVIYFEFACSIGNFYG